MIASVAIGNFEAIIKIFSQLPPGALRATIFSFASVQEQIVYFTVNYLFAPFFLIIPLMTASVIGANSFAGEKERKTLETLLFAPLDLNTLLWAKILAAFLPATFLTLICSFGTELLSICGLFGGSSFRRETGFSCYLIYPSPQSGRVLPSFNPTKFRVSRSLPTGELVTSILGLFIDSSGLLLVNYFSLWFVPACITRLSFVKNASVFKLDQLYQSGFVFSGRGSVHMNNQPQTVGQKGGQPR